MSGDGSGPGGLVRLRDLTQRPIDAGTTPASATTSPPASSPSTATPTAVIGQLSGGRLLGTLGGRCIVGCSLLIVCAGGGTAAAAPSTSAASSATLAAAGVAAAPAPTSTSAVGGVGGGLVTVGDGWSGGLFFAHAGR